MFAVFETGGKQYQAKPGDLLNVDLVTAHAGDKVIFNQVLLVQEDGQPAKVGQPVLKDMAITAEVMGEAKGPKIFMRTFKRRQGEHKQRGHRQKYTCVKVVNIGPAK